MLHAKTCNLGGPFSLIELMKEDACYEWGRQQCYGAGASSNERSRDRGLPLAPGQGGQGTPRKGRRRSPALAVAGVLPPKKHTTMHASLVAKLSGMPSSLQPMTSFCPSVCMRGVHMLQGMLRSFIGSDEPCFHDQHACCLIVSMSHCLLVSKRELARLKFHRVCTRSLGGADCGWSCGVLRL